MFIILPLLSTFLTLKIFEFRAVVADPPGNIGGEAEGTPGRLIIAVAIVLFLVVLHSV